MKFFSDRSNINALDLAVASKNPEQTASASIEFPSRNIEALDLAYKGVGRKQEQKTSSGLLSAAGENILFSSKTRNTEKLGLAFVQSMMEGKDLAVTTGKPGRSM